jgi:hypothetical protein
VDLIRLGHVQFIVTPDPAVVGGVTQGVQYRCEVRNLSGSCIYPVGAVGDTAAEAVLRSEEKIARKNNLELRTQEALDVWVRNNQRNLEHMQPHERLTAERLERQAIRERLYRL